MNWRSACRRSRRSEAEAPFRGGQVIIMRTDGEANIFKRYETGLKVWIRRATGSEIQRVGSRWSPSR